MAADKTASLKATTTLTASTSKKVNLTGKSKGFVELTHHADVTNPVYFAVASSEAALPAATVAGDNLEVLLPGERLSVEAVRRSIWVILISAGAATVTVASEG